MSAEIAKDVDSLIQKNGIKNGESLAQIQTKLNTLGHNTGKVDGLIGPNTRRGLKNFLDAGYQVTDLTRGSIENLHNITGKQVNKKEKVIDDAIALREKDGIYKTRQEAEANPPKNVTREIISSNGEEELQWGSPEIATIGNGYQWVQYIDRNTLIKNPTRQTDGVKVLSIGGRAGALSGDAGTRKLV